MSYDKTKTVAKMLQKCCKTFLHFCKTFYQAMFGPAKIVLRHFSKCFGVKHFKNILEVVTCKMKHQNILQHFCKCFILHVTTVFSAYVEYF